jgi:hypothetical protein
MHTLHAYLEDERSLTGRLGIDLPPIRKFDLSTFGLDSGRFLREFAASFDDLPWDQYDVKLARVNSLRHRFPEESGRLSQFFADHYVGTADLDAVHDLLIRLAAEERRALEEIRPHRRRALATFDVAFRRDGDPVFERVSTGKFSQNVGASDCRSLNRVFGESPEEVTSHPEFRHLMTCVVGLVNEVAAPRRAARVVFHQVRTVTRQDRPGIVVPEGIHQDGADYIVSALVIEREAVTGGESIVYGPDRQTTYLRTVLRAGEGLFHADSRSPLWHGVTPIRLDPHAGRAEGKRSIFGFDVHLSR